MDNVEAVLVLFAGVAAFALIWKILSVQVELARERLDIQRRRYAWSDKSHEKKSQKPRKRKEDDEDDDEDGDVVVELLTHPVVRGFAMSKGVNVDALLDGDRAEAAKVEAMLSKVGGGQQNAPANDGTGLLG